MRHGQYSLTSGAGRSGKNNRQSRMNRITTTCIVRPRENDERTANEQCESPSVRPSTRTRAGWYQHAHTLVNVLSVGSIISTGERNRTAIREKAEGQYSSSPQVMRQCGDRRHELGEESGSGAGRYGDYLSASSTLSTESTTSLTSSSVTPGIIRSASIKALCRFVSASRASAVATRGNI